ncbi:hypothetical protein AX16_009201 [Volvariella volvacea WC 439]|nr:hypothetical protein AX16_009201 [Volvariella volvacea WC 439]
MVFSKSLLAAFSALCLASTVTANASIHGHARRQTPLLTTELVREIFQPLGNGSSSVFFDNYVVEDVDWIVSNPLPEFATNPLAGHYTSLSSFRASTFNVVNGILTEPIRLGLEFDPIISGNIAVVELRAQNSVGEPLVSIYGYRYDCRYAWVVVFNDDKKITRVRAYLDSAMVRDLVTIPEGADPSA